MKIIELLNEKEKWTTGTFARDIFGRPVFSGGHEAISWCLGGAINKCYYDAGPIIIRKVEEKIIEVIKRLYKNYPANFQENGQWVIRVFNDNLDFTTFEDIQKVLDEADV